MDQLFRDGGHDRIYGHSGNDVAGGGPGDDEIAGGAGNDNLDGHEDDDEVFGHAGNDDWMAKSPRSGTRAGRPRLRAAMPWAELSGNATTDSTHPSSHCRRWMACWRKRIGS